MITNLRVTHANAGHFSRDLGVGTQLNRVLDLEFDAGGKLVAGTLQKTRELAFPVPLPPGTGGVTVPYPKHRLDVADDAVRAVAEQMHDIAARGGGITEVFTSADSRMVSVTRTGGRTALEHLPGAPLADDAARMGSSTWGSIKLGTSSVELARLGAAIRRLV